VASELASGGAAVPIVAAQLGHATASFTLNTYAHLRQHRQQAAHAIGAAFFPSDRR
jgi:integrase